MHSLGTDEKVEYNNILSISIDDIMIIKLDNNFALMESILLLCKLYFIHGNILTKNPSNMMCIAINLWGENEHIHVYLYIFASWKHF